MGAVVVPIAADAADEAAMTTAFRGIVEEHGLVNGIIHAAGVPATGVIQLKTREMAASVIDAKVKGTLILDSLVGDGALDFFILFSSINAVISPAGATDYASANAFLDAFPRHRRSRGDRHVVSINWDPWQEVGMAVNTEVPPAERAAKKARLEKGIAPSEGVEACRRILRSGLPGVVVSTLDLPAILGYVARLKLERLAAPAEQSGGARLPEGGVEGTSGHARPELPNPYVAPRNENERLIAGVWEGLLGVSPIGVHDNFFELGGHSLLATRVLAHLQDKVDLSLPLEAVFTSPTVAELAERIDTLRWVAAGVNDTQDQESGDREEFVI